MGIFVICEFQQTLLGRFNRGRHDGRVIYQTNLKMMVENYEINTYKKNKKILGVVERIMLKRILVK